MTGMGGRLAPESVDGMDRNRWTTRAGIRSLVGDQQILTYSIVLGPGPDRARTGTGVVAMFALRCLQPVRHSTIAIHSSPVLETRLVLADGATERRFVMMQGIEIAVGDPTLVEGQASWGAIKAVFVGR